ncbi:hypothetical protein CRG98_022280 [Punica granatum]|uniref:Uncharacterized protein n=1 Tax=Punica granatum TaxID=22663 RepID=A0A2I0JM18_PUNGR|nr:hypothetical protein CRG98_022280 [Punica granatum]
MRGRGRRPLHWDCRYPRRMPASSVSDGNLGGGIRVADWWPQPRINRGPPIRGWGRQSTTLTLPQRSLASSVGTGDLGGGVRVANWNPQP